jgi:hypothetical protein
LPREQIVVDTEAKYCYNRNKLASKVILSVVKIQQKEIPKVVDKGVERHYNRNKLASNVFVDVVEIQQK